jgi:hypothetical protein
MNCYDVPVVHAQIGRNAIIVYNPIRSLEDLIDMKKKAGRPQDMEDVAQLRKLRMENS